MKKVIPVLIVFLVLIAAAIYLVRHQHQTLSAEKPPLAWVVTIHDLTLTEATTSLSRPAVADVEAMNQTVLASRLTGYVTRMPLFEGSKFKRGDLLAAIEMSQSDGNTSQGNPSQGNSLKADLAAAQSSLMTEQALLQRSKKLYQIGGVSLEQVQAAESAFAAAESRLTVARENLHNASLLAPFDGVIAARLAQPGDLATPGKPLLRIVALGAQRLLVDVPEQLNVTQLLLDGKAYPAHAWPEATAQGLRRWEARVNDLMPGSKIGVDIVTFSGKGVFIPDDCMLNNDSRNADLLRLPTEGKQLASVQRIGLLASGVQGAIAVPTGLTGTRVACASPDILSRLAGGAPYHIAKVR